jgi:hypothetical protein
MTNPSPRQKLTLDEMDRRGAFGWTPLGPTAPVAPKIRRFVLRRHLDETGISGVGDVAWGVCFPDGIAVLRWASEHRSTAVYADMADLEAIHGHNGSTEIVWLDAA